MTLATRIFGNAQASTLDLDRFVKLARGKGERMEESMLGFGEILWDKSGRRMTVVAGRDRSMARFDPAIEMVLHDVTVGAGLGIVAQVGCTLRIDKGVASDTYCHADREGDYHGKQCRHAGCTRRRPLRRVCFHGPPQQSPEAKSLFGIARVAARFTS